MSENAAGLKLAAGSTLHERYHLTRALHSGAGGSVWEARDTATGARVVVKQQYDAAALEREWATLRAINHAHVVRALDFNAEPPALLVQHHIAGPTLADLDRIEFGELLRPVRLLLGALMYLHERDVSHGDLAPSNIVFDQGGAPFLIDFGSASRGGVVVGGGDGTPAYRSPERSAGSPASARDDIYALGRLLAEHDDDSLTPECRDLLDAMTGPAAGRPSAHDVDATLARLGIAATVLPERCLQGARRATAAPDAEPIEPLAATPHASSRAPRQPAVASSGGGLSPRVVAVAIAVLLALFAGVLFVLDRRPPPAADAQAAPVAASAEEVPVDEPADEEPQADAWLESQPNAFGENITFGEGSIDSVLDTSRLTPKQRAGRVLGELLAKQEVLEGRGVESWAPVEYQRALDGYASGDQYYLADDFENAARQYATVVLEFDRLIGRVTGVFDDTVSAADAAFASGESREAERLYEIALEITPNDPRSTRGLERARSLDTVLGLVEAAADAEFDGDYAAAKAAYDKALELDPEWQPAVEGAERTAGLLLDAEFREQMTAGFLALDAGQFGAARRAFNEARALKPASAEPRDGLLQVEQAGRLRSIRTLQSDAETAEREENWPAAVRLYTEMLKQDDNLALARDGLRNARARVALDETLARYLDDPDILTNPQELKAASGVLTRMSAIEPRGPRLAEQRDALTAALKRAATPVKVELVSDELTDVAVYKVGKLGQFDRTTLVLRPGLYTAVGTRVGFRDVRLEFRVAPEDPPAPVIVRCEEPI